MLNKKMKLLKLGILSSGTIIATPIVASASSYYVIQEANNSELIQIKINGRDESFFSVKEAKDYILRHNMAHMNQEVMIGNRRYLDKNSGMLNTSELHKYIADKDHVKPAYKMLNGNYTDSKDKALKTYVGRSHLVSQYYDFNGGYFDGTFAGREQAKDSIRKRQLDKIVPFNTVDFGFKMGKMHINPFNKKDQEKLQEQVVNIYKYNLKNINNRNPNVTATYMFPAADHNNKTDSYIGVEPNDYKKGLTSDDFQENSLQNTIEDFFENIVKFSFEVNIPSSAPYRFTSKDLYLEKNGLKKISLESEYKYENSFSWRKKLKNNYLEIRNRNKKLIKNAVHVKITDKKIKLSNISLDYLWEPTNIEEISAFMDYSAFWSYFKETKYHYKPLAINYETAKGAKLQKKLFGIDSGDLSIINTNPNNKFGAIGFDVAINQKAKVSSYTTNSIFKWNIPGDVSTSFAKYINSHPSSQQVKKEFKDIIQKIPKNTLIPNPYLPTNTIFSPASRSGDTYIRRHSMLNISANAVEQVMNIRNKAYHWSSKSLQKVSEILSKNTSIHPPVSKTNDKHKILLLDGTPIVEIDDKNQIINDNSIISRIEVSKQNKSQNYIYKIYKDKITSKQSGIWNSIIKPKIWTDFKKTYEFKTSVFQLIVPEYFNRIKYSDEYKNMTPIIFYKGKNKGRNNGHLVKPILLGKILSDHSPNVSIHKIGSELIFPNQAGLDKRKDQIASKYFQPPLVHVIYNDNDEVISEFQQNDSIIKFDDKETIKHNANAILSNYLRKDTNKVFVKVNGKWSKVPINNELIMVYNIKWEGNFYAFESFENVQKFIKTWIETTSNTVSERENND